MVVETEVPHHNEIKSMGNTVEMAISTNREVSPKADPEAIAQDDMKVTPLADTEVASLTSMKLFIHTDEGFPKGPNDRTVLNGFVHHVAL